jgi:uncharacterized tellurite resistance protein B-like protein
MTGLLTEMMRIASDNDFSLAKDLLVLAMADGHIRDEEKQTLLKICSDLNLTEERLTELINSHSDSGSYSFAATPKQKEEYLVKMIRMMGSDGESATEEIFLLEMIASKLGFSRMHLTSLVLLNATRKNFPNDYGAKVLSSFLENIVDPKGKSDRQNHDNIARVYNDIAKTTTSSDDPNEDKALLMKAFDRVTKMMLEDTLLVKEFCSAGLDLRELLEFESRKALARWTI